MKQPYNKASIKHFRPLKLKKHVRFNAAKKKQNSKGNKL